MDNILTDKKLIYYIVNHYIDMRKLLRKLGIDVKANNSMYCPFHDNQNTPAAHLYQSEDKSYCIWCYAEDKRFSNADLYKTYLPEINLAELATLLYNNLPEEEKNSIADKVNQVYELPELPYNTALQAFKNNQLSFQQLLNTINMTIPMDDTIRLLGNIYNMGTSQIGTNTNKYIYFMNNYESDYRFISANKLLINYGAQLPTYFRDYLKYSGDSIMLPNIINNTVYSLTLRNLQGPKQFIKVGHVSHLFYNLGHLPEDFHYGVPILLTEGNIDCDSIKQIYPYSLAALTNSLSMNQLQLLLHLTNKVILAYDNDSAGNKGYYDTYNKLKNLGFTVKRFKHSHNLKDFGDLIDLRIKDYGEYEYISMSYKLQIQNLLLDM